MFNFWKLSLVKRGIIILGGSCLRHLRHSRDLCSRASSDYHVYKIRKAAQKDVPIILKFITDKAVYEKQPLSSLTVSEKDLLRDGFGDHQYFHCLIPEYLTTDKGRRVLHVDDLFVEPEHRRKGVATLIKNETCKVAADNDCDRIQWLVFNWNKEAFAMYDKWGGKSIPEYVVCEMPREILLKHASNSDQDDGNT